MLFRSDVKLELELVRQHKAQQQHTQQQQQLKTTSKEEILVLDSPVRPKKESLSFSPVATTLSVISDEDEQEFYVSKSKSQATASRSRKRGKQAHIDVIDLEGGADLDQIRRATREIAVQKASTTTKQTTKAAKTKARKRKASKEVALSTPIKPEHVIYKCDACGKKPIVGVRHKCMICPDLDLCPECMTAFMDGRGLKDIPETVRGCFRNKHGWNELPADDNTEVKGDITFRGVDDEDEEEDEDEDDQDYEGESEEFDKLDDYVAYEFSEELTGAPTAEKLSIKESRSRSRSPLRNSTWEKEEERSRDRRDRDRDRDRGSGRGRGRGGGGGGERARAKTDETKTKKKSKKTDGTLAKRKQTKEKEKEKEKEKKKEKKKGLAKKSRNVNESPTKRKRMADDDVLAPVPFLKDVSGSLALNFGSKPTSSTSNLLTMASTSAPEEHKMFLDVDMYSSSQESSQSNNNSNNKKRTIRISADGVTLPSESASE